ncbi:MAG: MBL fold metallo-hydrolase [Spirochaetales bacterium]|nr:MBL fold metallo-hydrolase [Spirochaetales bacterium]
MIRYSVLASGSSGNGYVISDGECAVLFDAGFSLREIKRRVVNAGIDFATVQALFLTHLHPDHSRTAGIFARQTLLPVYMHESLQIEPDMAALRIPVHLSHYFTPGLTVRLGPFSIVPFITSHDSPNSVGFFISVRDKAFMLLTDTGMIYPHMLEFASRCDVLFLEANYDPELLKNGPYPWFLKQRISGNEGHLSNLEAVRVLRESNVARKERREVYLCHLSKINNNPERLQQYLSEQDSLNAECIICRHGEQYVAEID